MYELQPEKKAQRAPRGCVTILVVIGAVALALFACGLFGLGISIPTGTISAATPRNIVYKISTSREAGKYSCPDYDVTYEMPSGTAQKNVAVCDDSGIAMVDSRSGWSGDFVYLSVQGSKRSAKISCQIYVDGTLVHQTFSEGQYVIASCSGLVP